MFAAAMAARPASGRRTFGFYRTEILAALANGLILVVVAVLVFIEGVMRLSSPSDVDGLGVLIIGVVGLVGNVAPCWRWRAATVRTSTSRRCCGTRRGTRWARSAWASGRARARLRLGSGRPDRGHGDRVLILLSSWRLIKEPMTC